MTKNKVRTESEAIDFHMMQPLENSKIFVALNIGSENPQPWCVNIRSDDWATRRILGLSIQNCIEDRQWYSSENDKLEKAQNSTHRTEFDVIPLRNSSMTGVIKKHYSNITVAHTRVLKE